MEHLLAHDRLSVDDYFLVLAQAAARRSTCPRRQVGAVLVHRAETMGTGYNGSAPGAPHCTDVGCLLSEDGRCLRTIHAEVNAFRSATWGDTLYSTDQPCLHCLKTIVAHGVRRVVFIRAYPDADRDKWVQANELHFLMEQAVNPPRLILEGDKA